MEQRKANIEEIEFDNLEQLEEGVRQMVSFPHSENFTFLCHQVLDRSKGDISKRVYSSKRDRGSTESIFKNGFCYSSYSYYTQTTNPIGFDEDGQHHRVEPKNKIEKLTKDIMTYEYEPFLAFEKVLIIMALPKRIKIGDKVVPFCQDLREKPTIHGEESLRCPYNELMYYRRRWIDTPFILAAINFGLPEQNIKPSIQLNRDFIAYLSGEQKSEIMDKYAKFMIEEYGLSPKTDSQEQMYKKIEDKVMKASHNSYGDGSYANDFDFD